MKRILFFFFLFSVLFTSFSQDMNKDMPASWSQDIVNEILPIELPPLDLEALIAEDYINDLDKTIPWRYGVSRTLVLDFDKDGLWTTLPNGDRIWQVGIISPNAINISVNFNDFHLPEGARLHLYNNDRTDISKTYSSTQNRDNKILGSWFVESDFIWVEYYERANTSEAVKLEIGSIIHGYRMGEVNNLINNYRGMGDSGECNYDVNCSIGSDFDLKKDLVKKAVAILNLGNGFLCSASLINNTQSDKTPFLLTANHCLEYSDPSYWSVRFNWMSPNPVCGTGEESSDIQTNFTMSGAILKANNSVSDFALVELHNEIPLSWDVAFAGWDNTDDLPEYEIGIHHPNGDIMKICRDDSGAVRENANGTDVWLIGGTSVGTGNGWEFGTTESGSSGSPLFNQDGRIIGQLYAGQSSCTGFENNNDYDIYGRFGTSWNYGNTPQTRLMDWLDPIGTGQTTTESIQNILSTQDFELTGSLDIFPNPASTYITIKNSRYPQLVYRMYNVVGQQLLSGSLSNTNNEINVENLDKGIYFLYLLDRESNADMTKKIIID